MHTAAGRRGPRSPRLVACGLVVLLLVSAVVAVGIGPVPVHPAVVLEVLASHVRGEAPAAPPAVDAIVWTVRLPRVLLAVVVGATLSIAGVALQAMVRNVLADPYVLGVTSGASTGAAAAILLGFGSALGSYLLPVTAFAGALVATLAVLFFARLGGTVSSLRLVLAGIAIGYVLSSVTSFLIFASDSPEAGRSVLFWLLGSLNQARWDTLAVAAVVGLGTAVLLTALGGALDAIASGDETALTVGVDADRMRLVLALVVAVAVGTMVAVSGGIGFIGLVVPHLARALVGATHHVLVPVAALLGGAVLVWTDTLARTAFSPQELPIGIVTGLVGGPFLLVLLQRLHQHA
ncbi:FecCD family ABC transporter permease [Auraticoccus monumenti]|uniref:FecCD family ABC transporter permease n=1 Tax=Auraticoccus monumenti TaxID=675864 RepID=UPI000B81CB64|nr:iron ABC transporter permease [Auraticoccus monumenti]